jgi:hypothetical protein
MNLVPLAQVGLFSKFLRVQLSKTTFQTFKRQNIPKKINCEKNLLAPM